MSILILYASETGNAEELAFQLFKTIQQVFSLHNKHVSIFDIQDFNIKAFDEYHTSIFIISTSGEGDVPTGMKRFWNSLLKRSLSSTCLQSIQHAVFGLGDSSYEKYNAAARKLKKRLEQLGSTEICELGLGDDQAKYSYFEEADIWTNKLLLKLLPEEQRLMNIPTSILSLNTNQVNISEHASISASMSVSIQQVLTSSESDAQSFYRLPIDCKYPVSTTPTTINAASVDRLISVTNQPAQAQVLQNHRLTHNEWSQCVHHLVLQLPIRHQQQESISQHIDNTSRTISTLLSESPPYSAGDVAVIYPRNPSALVQRMKALITKFSSVLIDTSINTSTSTFKDSSARTQLVDTTMLSIKNTSNYQRKTRLPTITCTYQDLLSLYLDLGGRPKRSFFAGIAPYAQSKEEKEKLLELASPTGADIFFEYCIRERRNFVEVLEDFSSLCVPLSVLIELIPVIQPRQYSVASHGALFPDQIHLCVAVANTRTRYGRRVPGLCSSYLANLHIGDTVRLYMRQGVCTPTSLSEGSAVLVGPGTGIAPVRAIVQQRILDLLLKSNQNKSNTSSTTSVFFGCRKRGKDYLYENEWLKLKEFCHNYESTYHTHKSHTDNDGGANIMTPSYLAESLSKLRAIWDGSLLTQQNVNREGISDGTSANISNNLITTDSIPTSSMLYTVAFSQDNPQQKVYVTHNIRMHYQYIQSALLSSSGYVFISGSGKQMPSDVRQALVDALSHSHTSAVESIESTTTTTTTTTTSTSSAVVSLSVGDAHSTYLYSSNDYASVPTKVEADQLLSVLQRKGKYVLDTWS